MDKMDQFSELNPQHEAIFTQIDNPNDIKFSLQEELPKQDSQPKHDQKETLHLPENSQEVPPSQDLDTEASQKSVGRRPKKKTRPMPSEDRMRHSIADSLMEILANMRDPGCQRQCFELLQVRDPLQARSRILAELQKIDARRTNP
ncbi:uncharacterized protein LOC6502242 isoform X2 [Drosophila ananassae]|uniref:uncharacterized protein LOC6502242 isoform X2 n=1 Tax=Drosophila ananassae TaxID=7217 RepID=UPI0013A5E6E9|nr:uncharacterized protein LOC6502242 isoform X2 [Drosophila ananassae]